MSAFLARLAMRALGTLPTARPRVPAIFEPAAPADPLGAIVSAEAMRPADRSLGGELADRAVAHPSAEGAHVPRSAGRPHGERLADATGRAAHGRTGPRPTPMGEAGRSAPDQGGEPGSPPPMGRSLAPPVKVGSELRNDQAAPAPPTEAGMRSSAAYAQQFVRLMPGAAQPQIPPQAAAVTPSPIVRISIGRVEIRAGAGMRPAGRAAAHAPAAASRLLPLDAYLKGARGGGT